MAEKNPLLPPKSERREHLASADDSISSASGVHSEIPYPSNTHHPPAEITQRPKAEKSGSERNTAAPRSYGIGIGGSPNSSRSRDVANYNLGVEYTAKIPLASKFFFCILLFGITVIIIAMAACVYLILPPGDEQTGHSDISNIVLPLIVYIMNMVICCLFFLEAKRFQMRGYSQLFHEASSLTKINFRLISIYFVFALCVYAFLLHHKSDLALSEHQIDVIFLAVWFAAYLFMIGSQISFGHKFYVHNRQRPKPDLFFPQPNNKNYVQNSPMARSQQHSNANLMGATDDDQTEVISKLYKDKTTLMHQLEALKRKYERTHAELQEYKNLHATHSEGDGSSAVSDVIELKAQVQKLRNKLRSERETMKTLNTQIDSKQTVLEAQISETQQLKNVMQAKDDRIAKLMNEKESLERQMNGFHDQIEDLKLLYEVKEQEVKIAQEENERLRKKQQMAMHQQNSHNYRQ